MSQSISDLYRAHQGYVSDKWASYLPVYDRWFSSYKCRAVNLLEVGVQNGGSLSIWAKYFESAQNIIGCDISQACRQLKYADGRIKVLVGDINQAQVREEIITSVGASGFDIIIDDASHKSRDIVSTFKFLFPRLKPGGLYIAEDLHCSYWSSWQGGLWRKDSAMEFFKSLADIPNLEHWGGIYPRTMLSTP